MQSAIGLLQHRTLGYGFIFIRLMAYTMGDEDELLELDGETEEETEEEEKKDEEEEEEI